MPIPDRNTRRTLAMAIPSLFGRASLMPINQPAR
jgi:hypothetical protein